MGDRRFVTHVGIQEDDLVRVQPHCGNWCAGTGTEGVEPHCNTPPCISVFVEQTFADTSALVEMNRVFRSKMIRNSFWTLVGYGARLGIQALAFVLLARYLGPANYGAFSAVLALALMVSPFIDLGTYSIVVRDVAAGVPTPYAVGNSLLVTFLATPIGLVAYALFASITLPSVSLGLGLIVAIAVFV